ncbi:hypothetical protein NDI44_11265 [Trichocoleus sp. DQ-A3]|uniref:hypothetical protein n=1 Tax=Cyanophyceae TaxID=3028117 RepID=UPI001688EE9C|nr:hypothetical protein [Coleofasciculus sp. FACHB-125]MBD1902674.1 hypothetical protein [Coleofasciculus sp. FACHB-125]
MSAVKIPCLNDCLPHLDEYLVEPGEGISGTQKISCRNGGRQFMENLSNKLVRGQLNVGLSKPNCR